MARKKKAPDINILLTFDYELPLGGITQSYSHSLFEPADQLLVFAAEQKVPVVLFADILSYQRFSQSDDKTYTSGFRLQLQDAVSQGHDIQLHLHPHWLKTSVAASNFKPSPMFKLSDFCNNVYPDNIDGIVETGVRELTKICREAAPHYRCLAYRGGGYNLEPCSEKIIAALLNNGLIYDSTIVPGYFFLSAENRVDYRKVPKAPNWYLRRDGNMHNRGSDGLWEVPIASIPKSPFEMPTALKMKKYASRAPEERGPMMHTTASPGLADKLKMLMSYRMLTIDNYTYSPDYLHRIFDQYIKKFKRYDEISLSLIGHPKSMSNYSFDLLAGFIAHVRKKYGSSARFTTFSELAGRNEKTIKK